MLVAGGLLVLVSWGWVVLTAVLGRELARRVRGVHYPFLVACAFSSSGAWVVGLSSSIPLLLNTPGNFLIEAGLLPTTIPITETLGSPLNLTVMVSLPGRVADHHVVSRPRDETIELDELRTGGASLSRRRSPRRPKLVRQSGRTFSDWAQQQRHPADGGRRHGTRPTSSSTSPAAASTSTSTS